MSHVHTPFLYHRRRLRDLFAKSFYVHCFWCDNTWGPFPSRCRAEQVKRIMLRLGDPNV